MLNSKLDIKLRPTEISDLDTLFQFQLDKEGGYLAAFMPKDPTDKVAYINKLTNTIFYRANFSLFLQIKESLTYLKSLHPL